MRLINKDRALRELNNLADEFTGSESDFMASARDALCRRVILMAIDIIENINTVDVTDKHGHWKVNPNYLMRLTCSECGHHVYNKNAKTPKYCENCGAMLKGIKQEKDGDEQ